MRVGILAKKKKGICVELREEFERRGHTAKVMRNEEISVDQGLLEYDLLVLKSKKLVLLYAGVYASVHGIPVVPDPWVCAEIRNRIRCQYLVEKAGLPAPYFYFGKPEVLARGIPREEFARGLVLKHQYGSGAKSIPVVRSPRDLEGIPPDDVLYLQEFIEGEHYLVDFIEDDVRTFRKKYSPNKISVEGEVETPEVVRETVRSWRAVTEMPVGDLDLVKDDNGVYWVVDPGSFPSYEGWPDAVPKLVDLFLR
ncbi:MAG: ATP-grasp domain-containing protein [Promethearchaeota archaeon]